MGPEAYLIAPQVFGFVEGGICACDKGAYGAQGLFRRGDPDAAGNLDFGFGADFVFQEFEQFADAFGIMMGVMFMGIGEDYDKFFATEASHDVG